ncbi:histidine kinase [Kordia sp.]|uniref:sensor histidine kinase n=1 Tax=Kordia sp. TaxID=1965332 RepID=UPI003D27A193
MLRKLLFLLLPLSLCAQLSGVKNYYHDEGLFCKTVYNLAQDANGIIWIGTDNGLYAFDGKTFEPYDGSSALKDTEILTNFSIDDEIFVMTLNENYAYLKDGKFITKKENPELRKILVNGISGIIHDTISNKVALFKSHNTKHIYTYEKGIIEKRHFTDSVKIINYHDDIVCFFNSENDIIKLNLKNNTRTKVATPVKPNSASEIVSFGEKNVAFALGNEMAIYKIQNDSSLVFLDHKKTSKIIKNIYFLNDNEIWLTNHIGGITCYNIDSKKEKEVFSDFIINDFFKDKDQNVWFSTRNHGLFFWSKSKFQRFLKKSITTTEGENIQSIDGRKDSIYFGMNASKVGKILNKLQYKFIALDGIIRVHASKNQLFFATIGTIDTYDNQFNFIDKIKIAGALKNISEFDTEYLIITASGSANLLHKKTLSITPIFSERSYDAIPIDENHAFICSAKGLFKININNCEYTSLISEYLFFSGSKASDNCYAFGTNAGGIFILHNNEQQRLTKDNGLLSNSITKVIFESPTVLWAIGNRGINRIAFKDNYKTYTIDSFTEADGIPLATLNDFYLYNGFMYLATSKGLEIFKTTDLLVQKQLEENTKLVLNHIQYQDSIFKNTQIKIPYTKNSITINVSYPDYNSYGNTSLKYKLDNQEHYSVTKASDIILSSLQPGKHTLSIYGLNSSYTASKDNLIISIDVIPLFWQTLWFKMVAFAVLITLIYTILIRIYINRKKRIQEKIQTKKKLTELEVEVIKSQMNPHFISNCLNSIKLLNYKKDYANSQLYIDRFNRMLRFNLMYSNNTFVKIKDEITYLNDYLELEKLRFGELFDYIITHDSTIENLKIPSFLVQPFVENAIKHAFVEMPSQKGTIRIHFQVHTDETIEITIKDDGIGIENLSKSTQKKQSKGIDLIRRRMELYRQIFNIFSTLSLIDMKEQHQKGTKVQLKINHTHAI